MTSRRSRRPPKPANRSQLRLRKRKVGPDQLAPGLLEKEFPGQGLQFRVLQASQMLLRLSFKLRSFSQPQGEHVIEIGVRLRASRKLISNPCVTIVPAFVVRILKLKQHAMEKVGFRYVVYFYKLLGLYYRRPQVAACQ